MRLGQDSGLGNAHLSRTEFNEFGTLDKKPTVVQLATQIGVVALEGFCYKTRYAKCGHGI